jgi:hypothetical protein
MRQLEYLQRRKNNVWQKFPCEEGTDLKTFITKNADAEITIPMNGKVWSKTCTNGGRLL